jgi:PAS domain S-box-containing protein
MVIANEHGKITLVNALTEGLFGYKRHELLGQSVELLIPERYQRQHIHYRKEYGESPRLRPMGAGRELYVAFVEKPFTHEALARKIRHCWSEAPEGGSMPQRPRRR